MLIKGVKFGYLEVCIESIESCYWCDEFALNILVALIFLICD